jgi:hypothetical protein
VPQLDRAGQVEHCQHEGEHGHRGLRAEQQPALVVAVGQHPAVEAEQQHRQELQAGGDAERDARAAGQVEHQPVLGDPLPQVPDRLTTWPPANSR